MGYSATGSSRPLKYFASRRSPSSPLTATYDCTPHSRLVGRLDLQNISAACTACLFQQAVRMPVRPLTAGSASRPYPPPQSSSRNQQPQTNHHKPSPTNQQPPSIPVYRKVVAAHVKVHDDGEQDGIRKERGPAIGDKQKRDAEHRQQREDHPHIHEEVNQEEDRKSVV